METTPVDLTIKEVAEALDVSTWTVLRHVRGDDDAEKWFPNAYLLHGSTKLGYRIPEKDVLARARLQGEWLVEFAEAVIERARSAQQAGLERRRGRRRDPRDDPHRELVECAS